MDSMKTLNTSLPTSQTQPPPEELLLAFKNAATSVTKLFKQASTGFSDAQKQGYQAALDDLLTFLDRRNLGLDDGEGWQVRQWATERLDGPQSGSTLNDTDDERDLNTRNHNRDSRLRSSPAAESSPVPQRMVQIPHGPITSAPLSAPLPSAPAPLPRKISAVSAAGDLTPATSQLSAIDVDMHPTDSINSSSAPPQQPPRTDQPIARASRTTNRQTSRPLIKAGSRSLSARTLGAGGGLKRKPPHTDFFDLGNYSDGREHDSASSKRGRLL